MEFKSPAAAPLKFHPFLAGQAHEHLNEFVSLTFIPLLGRSVNRSHEAAILDLRSNEVDKLSHTVADGFINSYRDFAQRVHALSENLSEEQFWSKPYPYGNSFGHLTLHLIGNLNYYIGAQIAGTGYVRDREREFTEGARPSKEEVLRRLDEAVALVLATIETQTAESWSKQYEAEGAADIVKDRFSIILRCAAHFHHHVGQMIYLEKELSK